MSLDEEGLVSKLYLIKKAKGYNLINVDVINLANSQAEYSSALCLHMMTLSAKDWKCV